MKFTRVLLAVPPEINQLEIYRVAGVKAPPLGLAYIAAVLEKFGHIVKIIDSPTLSLKLPDFLKKVKRFKPDIVGLTAITPTIYKAYKAAKAIKSIYPEIPIMIGGPHATFMYEEALSKNHIDFVVRGEGEYTSLELINTLEKYGFKVDKVKEVKGIAYKYNGQIYVTEPRPVIRNLDELPKPARHLLPMDRYTFLDKPIKIFHLMASRGCPYGCLYCSTSYFWGRYVRFRSVDSVIDEIKDAVYKHKISNIVFTDDELTVNKRWIIEFSERIRQEGLDIHYTAGSRVDRGTIEILKALKTSGCGAIYYGVESASQVSLDRIGKRITISMVKKAFENAKKVGLEVIGSFILGFPWETVDDMKDTIKFAIDLKPSFAQFTVLTPYPGTPIYYQALRENLIEDFNWENYTTLRAVMRGYHFTRKILQKMLSLAYRKFYLRISYLLDLAKRGMIGIAFNVLTREIKSILSGLIKRS